MTAKIGIVGLGYWGPKLVEALRSVKGSETVLLCDLDPKVLAEMSQKFNLEGTNDFERLLEGDKTVDAVVVATPPATHAKLVKRALEAGKHVFVEKPLATNFAEAKSLADLSEERNLILFVDHTFCYDGALRKVRELVQKGELGEIRKASFEWLGARQKPQGPDVLWDSGPHAAAAMLYVLDQPAELISAEALRRLETGVISALSAKFALAHGGEANMTLAWKDQELDGNPVPKAARVTLYGREELVFEGSFGMRGVTLRKNGEAHPLEGVTLTDEPLKNALQAFVDAVLSGKKYPSDGRFGAEVVSVLGKIAERLS